MKRKCVVVGIILLCVVTSTITSFAQDITKPYRTTLNSHWLYVGGNGPGNYTKIQDAIDDASQGDVIFVFSGIYYENILIHKSLHLIGENTDTTIIDGQDITSVVLIIAHFITVERFTIQNSSYTPSDHSGGVEVESNHTTISHNRIVDNFENGIYVNQASYTTISENNISQSHHGIWIAESSRNTITMNIIYNNFMGILLGSTSKNQIIANTIYHNHEYGILLADSTRNDVQDNIIFSDDNDSIGISLQDAHWNTIQSNTIAFHRNIGISIQGSIFNVISNNAIQGNDLGVDIYWGYYNTINRNNFLENRLDADFSLEAPCRFLMPLVRNNWINNY
jgi:nitrous oxidase accessory protein